MERDQNNNQFILFINIFFFFLDFSKARNLVIEIEDKKKIKKLFEDFRARDFRREKIRGEGEQNQTYLFRYATIFSSISER